MTIDMNNDLETSGLLYIAAPYTSESATLQQHRAEVAQHALDIATTFEALAYSPLNHLAEMMPQTLLLTDNELSDRDLVAFFYQHGLGMLRRCDALVVLQLEGWERSQGVRWEIHLAEQLGMPILYIEEERLLRSDARRLRELGEELRELGWSTGGR